MTDEAPRQSREELLAIPSRLALAVALSACMVVAGWGRPWWVVIPLVLVWPALVVVGVIFEYRDGYRWPWNR